tara:strand:- start:366 stop:536 length:171 start_codon:yes stop_codon:yes gene_type:complete
MVFFETIQEAMHFWDEVVSPYVDEHAEIVEMNFDDEEIKGETKEEFVSHLNKHGIN